MPQKNRLCGFRHSRWFCRGIVLSAYFYWKAFRNTHDTERSVCVDSAYSEFYGCLSCKWRYPFVESLLVPRDASFGCIEQRRVIPYDLAVWDFRISQCIQTDRYFACISGWSKRVFSEVFYPGWRSSVDGEATKPVLCIDTALRVFSWKRENTQSVFRMNPRKLSTVQ